MMLPKLGDELIDLQHSYFETLLNSYEDIFKAELTVPGKKLVITRLLENLIEYSHIHFATEELQMRDQGYPYIAEHEDFVRLVQVCHRKIDNMDVKAFVEIVKSWLEEHILRFDRHYILWVAENPSSQSLSDILNDEESEVTEIMFSPVV